MDFDEMIDAVKEAETTQRIADGQINRMAGLISGKLRACSVWHGTLRELKRELKNFNMATGQWRK